MSTAELQAVVLREADHYRTTATLADGDAVEVWPNGLGFDHLSAAGDEWEFTVRPRDGAWSARGFVDGESWASLRGVGVSAFEARARAVPMED